MSDFKLTWNEWGADATVEGHDLALEDGLATAEALRWLVEDGVASRVDVSAAMPRLGLLSLAVNITLVNGESSTYAFSYPLE